MKLLALLEDLDGPSARLRFFAFHEALVARGVSVTAEAIPRAGAGRRRLLARARGHDVVFVQRRLLPPWEVWRLRHHARRLVYDFDDALLYRDHAPFPSLARRIKWRAWLRAADQVIAGSEVLVQRAAEQGRIAVCIPTTVEAVPVVEGATPDRLVWIGQPTTTPYLVQILPWIEELCRRRGVRVEAVGAAPVAADFVDVIAWSQEAERAALGRAWAGLAPLPQDPWTEGKCAVRVLRALSAGLPVVASPVGAQAELALLTSAVLAARGPEDWRAAIVDLLDCGEDRRADLVRAARELQDRFSPAVWEERWLQAVLGERGTVADPASGR